MGAVFCVGRSASGAPPVAAEAPPASDNKPAAPNTGTAFAPRFRFRVYFAFAILKSSRSIPWVGITPTKSYSRVGRQASAYRAWG